jgi:hypothetical protein
MRRIGIGILSILLLTLLPAVQAYAASFISIGADPSIGDPHLHVFFKEVGVGGSGTVSYQATSDATATYDCLTSSGNVIGHKTITAQESAMKGETADGKGKVIVLPGSPEQIVISPPPAGNFSCPGGRAPTLASVIYTHLVLTDLTHGVSISSGDTYTFP